MSNPSVTPALAAHREALVGLVFGEIRDNFHPQSAVGFAVAVQVADAVLAYFADPAHGLVRDEPSEGERAALINVLLPLSIYRHGCDRYSIDSCADCAEKVGEQADAVLAYARSNEPSGDQRQPNMDDGDADDDALCDDCAPARSDDGRTAVERVTEVDRGQCLHIWVVDRPESDTWECLKCGHEGTEVPR